MWTRTEKEAFLRLKDEQKEIFTEGYRCLSYKRREKFIEFSAQSFIELERKIFD